MKDKKPDWCNVILKFSHEITADKITIFRTENTKRTLLGQINDETEKEFGKEDG